MKIVILEGRELRSFVEYLDGIGESIENGQVYRLRIAIDDYDGVKAKVNEYVWSPGYGRLEYI